MLQPRQGPPYNQKKRFSCRFAAGAATSDYKCNSGLQPLRALRLVPIENILAGPEQHVTMGADMGEGGAEVSEPVRCAHDVGMHYQAMTRADLAESR